MRDSQGKAFLSGRTRPHLPPVLRRAARGDLDCPRDCPYLQQAREHEKPRPADQFDRESLFLQVEIAEQFLYEHEHLLMGLSYALARQRKPTAA